MSDKLCNIELANKEKDCSNSERRHYDIDNKKNIFKNIFKDKEEKQIVQQLKFESDKKITSRYDLNTSIE